MPSIGQFSFVSMQGVFQTPAVREEFCSRRGLGGFGVGFDTEMIPPSEFITRALVPASSVPGLVSNYRSLQTYNFTVFDGTETKWVNVLVVKVHDITWEMQIYPAGYYLVTARWVLLPDLFQV